MTFTEEQIQIFVASSIEEYGAEHTHDFECRTWRGDNWMGACNCTLSQRSLDTGTEDV